MHNKLEKEETDVGSHQEGVCEMNIFSLRIWKLLRPRTQERRIQRQLLMSSQQDKYLISASPAGSRRSGQGLGSCLSN